MPHVCETGHKNLEREKQKENRNGRRVSVLCAVSESPEIRNHSFLLFKLKEIENN